MRPRATTQDHQARARLVLPIGHRKQASPLGSPTRGKTAPGRLRGVDTLAILYAPQLLRPRRGDRARAPFVDLGYGATPETTLESAARFRRRVPGLPVVGYEIDRARVSAARAFEDDRTRFRVGGFDFALESFETGAAPRPARLVRAFNVLRQYDESSAAPALRVMAERVEPEGLLIEGSSDPAGALWSAQLVRAGSDGPTLEALAFGIPQAAEFTPASLLAVLPKRFVHRVMPQTALHAFFERWEREWRRAVRRGHHARLAASVRAMRGPGRRVPEFHVDPRPRWLRRGIVLWRCPLDGLGDPKA